MKFAVLGDPIAHSKSPRMHAAAYKALGLSHSYEAICAEEKDLAGLVQRLRDGEFAGFNVTVPHKRAILEHVDVVAASAEVVGAANTIALSAGKVLAHNTDMGAVAGELRALLPDANWSDASALVLGNGGAARAAIGALAIELKAKRIAVRARSFAIRDAGRVFKEDLDTRLRNHGAQTEIVIEPWRSNESTERDLAAIVQTTSAGMVGADSGDTVVGRIAWDHLPKTAGVMDVIYAPPQTPLLRAAAARSLRWANGEGMLARQGAIAFELWLGVAPPLDVMNNALKG